MLSIAIKHIRRTTCIARWFAIIACLALASGCNSGTVRHPKYGWNASKFFQNAKSLELCQAINDQDIVTIAKLARDKELLNDVGQRGMTPLLWAMGQKSSNAFAWLLDHGVDPDTKIVDALDNPKTFQPNASPLCICIVNPDKSYALALLNHGADPNFMNGSPYSPPLHAIIRRGIKNKWERIQLILDHGADINSFDYLGYTPVINAIHRGGQYDIALRLLNAGADHKLNYQNRRLIHFVVADDKTTLSSEQQKERQALLQRLEELGESAEEARKELSAWLTSRQPFQ